MHFHPGITIISFIYQITSLFFYFFLLTGYLPDTQKMQIVIFIHVEEVRFILIDMYTHCIYEVIEVWAALTGWSCSRETQGSKEQAGDACFLFQ